LAMWGNFITWKKNLLFGKYTLLGLRKTNIEIFGPIRENPMLDFSAIARTK